ncbi:bifunctional hydroxymethylpyrimidine kinase/phosphomethylpyrimidine kinase [Methanofollis fontis]|uniref:Bifunctional hydroxymethylpyrimidine kinase/phosphomethylpyrimidine kinase n=1 Tax=Methanofollis fontis TaxID=2052832 RepID=A0A483CPE7_9EURY|nr:bifunctional hydroxymethylpyrimidine kinase/phosphomethylpyrimidine kinase [Methanofollis fontis]TAJ44565.1 bifunctional hydroxymethylpyrimidine kinase/phosphomethylpyrimidine kinase [Methanofollis fontis]
MYSIPCALSIAGSDSGGGAGIEADLAAFAALGVWGTAAVTAVTAQNPGGVAGAWPLPPGAVAAQMEAVFAAFPVGAAKTGMLAEAGIIRAVAAALPEGVPLVVDPVMVATSGARLLAEEAADALIADLIPRAAVVTPNIPEAEALALTEIQSPGDMRAAAEAILAMGAAAVIVKGGHLEGEPADLLLDHEGELVLTAPRSPYQVHGSGCCFSASLTAGLARGMDLREAFAVAKAFTADAIRHAVPDLAGRRSVRPLWCGGWGRGTGEEGPGARRFTQ